MIKIEEVREGIRMHSSRNIPQIESVLIKQKRQQLQKEKENDEIEL